MPVHLQQSAKDLKDIATSVVANPTVFKQVRRSGAISPFRRSVQSKGAMASAAASAGRKGVSVAISFIPLPVFPDLLGKAWDATADYLTSRAHKAHINSPQNLAEKVKFSLKELGDAVSNWDNYRWKIEHASKQLEKAGKEAVTSMTSKPCDTWVRVWAKYIYLGSRIEKLRASVASIRAITDEIEVWLLSVEQKYQTDFVAVQAAYDKDVTMLKTGQFHDSCSDVKCMFKRGSYTKQASVPTSDPSKFFIKVVSKATGSLTDKLSDGIDKAAAL
jgi:hypothetical protein